MKNLLHLLIIVLITLFTSCSKDNDTLSESSDNLETKKKIKKLTFVTSDYSEENEFVYTDSILTSINVKQVGEDWGDEYTNKLYYNDLGQLTRYDLYVNTDYEYTVKLAYSNDLIKYHSPAYEWSLGDTIFYRLNSSQDIESVDEFNDNGDYYKKRSSISYTYISNNISNETEEVFNEDGSIEHTYTSDFEYDNKTNPFLISNSIMIFMYDCFHFSQLWYPYSRNNVTEISKRERHATKNHLNPDKEYSILFDYTYDKDDYPIAISISDEGEVYTITCSY